MSTSIKVNGHDESMENPFLEELELLARPTQKENWENPTLRNKGAIIPGAFYLIKQCGKATNLAKVWKVLQ